MHIVIFITCANKKEAEKISAALIENKLAACVNIIGGVASMFHWKGKVDSAKELLLIIKSTRKKFPALAKIVKSLHSYDTPEIIAFPVIAGEARYLKWIDESLR